MIMALIQDQEIKKVRSFLDISYNLRLRLTSYDISLLETVAMPWYVRNVS
jgi:hypothetical protein